MHIDADSFAATVDAGPVRGFASHAGAAHRGEDWGDDLVAEGEQGGDGACGECPVGGGLFRCELRPKARIFRIMRKISRRVAAGTERSELACSVSEHP